MKVVDVHGGSMVRVFEILAGDVFVYCGAYYMRTNEDSTIGNSQKPMCVNVGTGSVHRFLPNEQVREVRMEARVIDGE